MLLCIYNFVFNSNDTNDIMSDTSSFWFVPTNYLQPIKSRSLQKKNCNLLQDTPELSTINAILSIQIVYFHVEGTKFRMVIDTFKTSY
jgi:hypothetical protein